MQSAACPTTLRQHMLHGGSIKDVCTFTGYGLYMRKHLQSQKLLRDCA